MSEATVKALLREVEELKAARIRDALERADELAALRERIRALADETGSAFPYVQVRELRALLGDAQ